MSEGWEVASQDLQLGAWAQASSLPLLGPGSRAPTWWKGGHSLGLPARTWSPCQAQPGAALFTGQVARPTPQGSVARPERAGGQTEQSRVGGRGSQQALGSHCEEARGEAPSCSGHATAGHTDFEALGVACGEIR